jgi:hypothetical protein
LALSQRDGGTDSAGKSEAHMVLLEGSGSVSAMFRKGRRYLFLVWGADCDYMQSFLEFMSSPSNPKRISKVGVVYGNRPRGLGHAQGAQDHAKRLGLDVVFDERISDQPDYADIFRRGNASGAEVVPGTSRPWRSQRASARLQRVQVRLSSGCQRSHRQQQRDDGRVQPSDLQPADPSASRKFTRTFARLTRRTGVSLSGGYACGQVLQQAVGDRQPRQRGLA